MRRIVSLLLAASHLLGSACSAHALRPAQREGESGLEELEAALAAGNPAGLKEAQQEWGPGPTFRLYTEDNPNQDYRAALWGFDNAAEGGESLFWVELTEIPKPGGAQFAFRLTDPHGRRVSPTRAIIFRTHILQSIIRGAEMEGTLPPGTWDGIWNPSAGRLRFKERPEQVLEALRSPPVRQALGGEKEKLAAREARRRASGAEAGDLFFMLQVVSESAVVFHTAGDDSGGWQPFAEIAVVRTTGGNAATLTFSTRPGVIVDRDSRRLRKLKAVAGLEEAQRGWAEVERHFDVVPGDEPDGPRVLFLFPPGQKVIDAYRRRAGQLFVLKPEHEPSGLIDRQRLLAMVREIDPHYLATFVNDSIDAALLSEEVTPSLQGITHMGVGYSNIDRAAVARRGLAASYVGGDAGYNPLRWATAEAAEMLLLAAWFDLPSHVERAGPGDPAGQRPTLGRWYRNRHFDARRERILLQMLWAQMLRQMKRLDDGQDLIRRDLFRGAGNGPERTVRGHQLSPDPKIGLKTSIGFLSGAPRVISHWARLARAHGMKEIFYCGVEDDYEGLTRVRDPAELARRVDYLLRSPGAPALPGDVVEEMDQSRGYPWRVDPDELALKQAAGWDWAVLSENPLAGKTVGIVGLGSVGSAAAQILRPLGARLISLQHDKAKAGHYADLHDRLGVEYVLDLETLLDETDAVIFAVPDTQETKGMLSPDLLRRIGDRRMVLVNVGRGSLVGGSLEQERAFAAELAKHPNIYYATDVLRNEMLPLAEQPLLASELSGQVIVSPHIASNAGDPHGVSVREDGMGMVMVANFEAMRDGKPLPNPIPPLAGLEEIRSVLIAGSDPEEVQRIREIVEDELPSVQVTTLELPLAAQSQFKMADVAILTERNAQAELVLRQVTRIVIAPEPEQLGGLVDFDLRQALGGLEETADKAGFVVDAGVGVLRSRMELDSPYYVVADGARQAKALVRARVPAHRIVALVADLREKRGLMGRGVRAEHIFVYAELREGFLDRRRVLDHVWEVTGNWLRALNGVEGVVPLRMTERFAQVLLAQLQELLPQEWQALQPVTIEQAEQILRLYQLGV